MKNLNINSYVWIKLTEEGKKMLALYDEPVTSKGYEEKRPTKNGYTRFQLNDVMNIFGSVIYCGNNKIPFGTNIKIDEKDLLDCAPYTRKNKAK